MPSVLLGNPLASGAQRLVSGWPWTSGSYSVPTGGIQLRLHPNASGNCYVGLSGSVTAMSGGFFMSGSLGWSDGMIMAPGDSYFVPKAFVGPSGNVNIWIRADAACSGQSRLFFELM